MAKAVAVVLVSEPGIALQLETPQLVLGTEVHSDSRMAKSVPVVPVSEEIPGCHKIVAIGLAVQIVDFRHTFQLVKESRLRLNSCFILCLDLMK